MFKKTMKLHIDNLILESEDDLTVRIKDGEVFVSTNAQPTEVVSQSEPVEKVPQKLSKPPITNDHIKGTVPMPETTEYTEYKNTYYKSYTIHPTEPKLSSEEKKLYEQLQKFGYTFHNYEMFATSNYKPKFDKNHYTKLNELETQPEECNKDLYELMIIDNGEREKIQRDFRNKLDLIQTKEPSKIIHVLPPDNENKPMQKSCWKDFI